MNKYYLHLGAQIRCLDGLCGKLLHIIVNPATKQVTDLVISVGFLKQARVLPLNTVIYTTTEEIHLALCTEELSDYAKYEDEALRQPTRNHYFRLTPLNKSTLIENSDGVIGRLSQLTIESQTGNINLLRIRQGLVLPEHLTIPASYIESISSQTICLLLPYRALDNFKLPHEQYAW